MIKYLYIFFNLLALTAIIFAGVDIFYRLVRLQIGQTAGVESVKTPDPVRPPRPDLPASRYQAVIDRNIFGAATTVASAPAEEVVTEVLEDLAPTSLKITLLGTITGDQENARAIIADDNKKTQGLYRIADAIQGAIIKKILRGKVIVRVNGEDQVLTMAEDGGSATEKGTAAAGRGTDSPISLRQDELQQSFNNINQLLSQVRIRPYFKDGKADGFIVNRIRPDSLFNKLGLQNGDIIHTVNGQDIKSPEDAIAFYNSLKSDSHIALLVTRQGQRKTLNYNIR